MNITRKIKMEMCAPQDFENLNKEFCYPCKKPNSISIGETKKEIESAFKEMNSVLWRVYNTISFKCGTYIYLDKDWGEVSGMNNELYVFTNEVMNEVKKECPSIHSVPSSIILRLISDVVSKIASVEAKKEIKRGDRKTPEFNKGVPMGIGNKQLRFYKKNNDNEYYVRIYGIWFKTILSKDHQGNRMIINHIMNGDEGYKASDSTLSVKEKGKNIDFILNLSVKMPESKELYDRGVICGIDLGMKNLAVCTICDKSTGDVITNEYTKKELIEKIDDMSIIEVRNKYKAERERIRKKCELTGISGHGRKAKMNRYYDFGHKEKNVAKNIYHNVSRKIIKFCKGNNVGVIHMENLKGYGKKECMAASLWGYYELQQMIEYKAKKDGIDVVYVNPKNTSKTCSECGHVNENLALKDRDWICPHCGKHHDRDINAAINIARMLK